MKKIIVIADKMGDMSSLEVATALNEGIKTLLPGMDTHCVPITDGGEGTLEAYKLALGGEQVELEVTGPFAGEKIKASYGKLFDGVAVIELAATAGKKLVEGRENVGEATTYGAGELMLHAMRHGAARIVLALGGEAALDGGCGAAVAMGAKFMKKDYTEFVPTASTLSEIASIDYGELMENLGQCEVMVNCDAQTMLCGENGTAAVEGPAKGATPEQIAEIDAGLGHMAEVIAENVGTDVRDWQGAGVAGGMAAGAAVFFGGLLMPSVDIALDTVHYDRLLKGADVVFIAEGAAQQPGKVAVSAARMAKEMGVKTVVIAPDAKAKEAEYQAVAISEVVDAPAEISAASLNAAIQKILEDMRA